MSLTTSLLLACVLAARGADTAIAGPARAGLSVEQAKVLDALFAAVPAAARAWPGYDFLDKPFLAVLADGSAVLVGSATSPPGFKAFSYRGRLVRVAGKGPDVGDRPFNGNCDLSGVKVVVARINKDHREPEELISYAMHEHFHDYQDDRFAKRSDGAYRVEEAEDVALVVQENGALSRWLESGDAGAMRDFAALRETRRKLFPGTAAERGEEDSEGTAFFVEQAAAAAIAGAKGPKTLIRQYLALATAPNDLKKQRLYAVGAVLGRFLETRMPGRWQREVASGSRLSDIVLAEIALKRTELDARIARLTATPDYAAQLAAARRSVSALQDRRNDMTRRFYAQPGLSIHWSRARDEAHDWWDGSWFDYPDGSMMFDPVLQYAERGFELKEIMLLRRSGSELEFFLAPGGRVEIDGAIWTPKPGRLGFSHLAVVGQGVLIESGAGILDYDGRVLNISF